jgi:hypothetical protein
MVTYSAGSTLFRSDQRPRRRLAGIRDGQLLRRFVDRVDVAAGAGVEERRRPEPVGRFGVEGDKRPLRLVVSLPAAGHP